MRGRAIERTLRAAMALAVVGGSMLAPAAASASGGGGCGRPVTDGAGSAVRIRAFCFAPTILHVAPGDEVTFTNRDPVRHNVLGAHASWGGFDTLRGGSDATYRFEEPGIYPYVCTIHPGMVGAVMVGSGDGGAIDTTTAAGPVVRVPPPAAGAEEAPPLAVATAIRPAGGIWPTVLVVVAGVLSLGGVVFLARRSRRRSLA